MGLTDLFSKKRTHSRLAVTHADLAFHPGQRYKPRAETGLNATLRQSPNPKSPNRPIRLSRTHVASDAYDTLKTHDL